MGKSTVSASDKALDVFLSDFLQDMGTPLQWLLAWEAVAERERPEQNRAARSTARVDSGEVA